MKTKTEKELLAVLGALLAECPSATVHSNPEFYKAKKKALRVYQREIRKGN